MKINDKASVSIIRIILITILFFCICSLGIKVFGLEVNNVEIVFPDNTKINVFTNKTLVSEILEENHIIILDDETVSPCTDSEILSDNKIVISNDKQQEVQVIKLAESKTDVSMDDLLSTYVDIKEKIITEDIEIPYETITKDVSEGDSNTTTKVLQEGVNGIKRVTAKVKYQNDLEIDRNVLKEEVIKQPVNKIVQVNKVVTTSRGASMRVSDQDKLNTLYAIVMQEGGANYDSALAVMSCILNRCEDSKWAVNGKDPYSQATAKGQFCYSIDGHWKKYDNGNVPNSVKKAVNDALNGARNHKYTSFRSARTRHAGEQIGGNVYF